MMLKTPPLSLYVHLPWCVRKCPYCDFNSHAAPERIPQSSYIDALLADLDHDLDSVAGRPVVSIFFGGGTPSLFDPEEIGRFIAAVRSRVQLASDVEVTLEANPGTIEHGRFAGYRDAGVNRVSLGVQSFNEGHLRALGRIHDAGDIHRAVDELRRAQISNFNLDLMYGLPAQSLEEAVRDLEMAIALQPMHISHYQLTLEPGTVFYHRPPPLPDVDATWEMQQHCQDRLARADYEQYEVSAYARAPHQCRHNLNYWQFGDYLGLGAGAHAKITRVQDGEVLRLSRVKHPRTYLSCEPRARLQEHCVVPIGDLPFEFMLNALRLAEGFSSADFEARTGLPIESALGTIENAVLKGLLEQTASGWRASGFGRQFLNDLQQMFLPPIRDPKTRSVQPEPLASS